MSAFSNARDRSSAWQYQPYGVKLGTDFATYKEALLSALTIGMVAEGKSESDAKTVMSEYVNAKAEGGDLDIYGNESTLEGTTVSDSSILGNEALNPYAGFNRDDDIVHTMFTTKEREHDWGMGRVYREIYDSKQQIMYMQFGLPKYRNLRSYLYNATDSEMAEVAETGKTSILTKLTLFAKGTIKFAIELPWLPLEWAYRAVTGLKEYKVTEYFYFKEQMLMYFKHVNQLMSMLAVDMGLYAGQESDSTNLPSILRDGPDIFRILVTRSNRFKANKIEDTTDSMVSKSAGDVDEDNDENLEDITDPAGRVIYKVASKISSALKNLWNSWQTSALDGAKFISFRIEKGSDNASETFSNTVQESSIQQRLNGLVAQHRENTLSADTAGEDFLSTLNRTRRRIGSAYQNLKNFFTNPTGSSAASVVEFASASNGFFDLPQQWCGSQFSRSVSVSIRLRAKTGGDPASVYTSIMVPLACLIAGAIPRATGNSTYTSPFIMRAWCRGMFAIPAGIIQSLSISRGDAEFGWNLRRQPTVVSVNMQIADLSPILFMGLTGSSLTDAWGEAFSNNSKLHEYVSTLAGVGLKQRYYKWQVTKRKLKAAMLMTKNTAFSSTYWGLSAGDTWFSQMIGACAPLDAMRIGNN